MLASQSQDIAQSVLFWVVVGGGVLLTLWIALGVVWSVFRGLAEAPAAVLGCAAAGAVIVFVIAAAAHPELMVAVWWGVGSFVTIAVGLATLVGWSD